MRPKRAEKPEDMTAIDVVEVIADLYRKGSAQAWFDGQAWPPGARAPDAG